MISVTTSGIEKLVGDLGRLPEKVETGTIQKMSQIAYQGVQDGAGRHFKRGALFQSAFNRAIAGGRAVGHDTNRAPYAPFVVFGTRPHTITPKNKKVLRWVGGGGFVFSKRVNHPGYRGDDYLLESRDKALASFGRIVDEELRAAI